MGDLKTFRERVQSLYHSVRPFAHDRRPTVDDLAHAIGLSRAELSRRLNGSGKLLLTCANAQAILRTLAKWGALQTQAQAVDLLVLLGCAPFAPQEWQSPPLDQLARSSPASQARFEQGGNNLPLQTTSFVGRDEELATLAELLASTPLLSIVGAGGMGKTRLAIELAVKLLPAHPDGCWLVSLAPLTEGYRVASAVANVLGLREEAGQPTSAALVDYLRSRKLLLVLDNCEHLLAACADLVKLLLAACSHLRILITSREPLGITDETEWRLSPLLLPGARQLSPVQAQDYAAVALFVNRVQAALPRFRLDERNTPSVVQLCQQLEGIPLSLELTAPLVKVLSPAQLTNRLDGRLRLLRSSDPTTPSRQHTVRASMEWSYDLLDEAERTLLRRLAVFAGGWSLEAAEVICSAAPSTSQQPQPVSDDLQAMDVLRGHIQLVNKSLVQAGEQAGVVRYTMLEVMRQFATDLLAKSGEEVSLRQRHAHLYLALAEQAEPELRTGEQALWLARLDAEHNNLTAALGWLLQHEPEAALRLAGTQWLFWLMRSYISEGRRWLVAALAQSEAASLATRAKVTHGMAVMTYEQGGTTLARTLLETNLAVSQQLKDDSGVAATLFNLGIIIFEQGDYQTAGVHFEQALSIRQRLDDRWGIAACLSRLSAVFYAQGDQVAASAYLERGMVIVRELGEQSLLAELLMFKGERARHKGDYSTAEAALRECLTISQTLGNKVWTAAALVTLGRVARDRGDYPAAHDLFSQSIRTKQAAEETLWVAPHLEAFASLAAAQNQAQAAVQLLAAATALRQAVGSTMKPFEREQYERTTTAARAQLSEAEFEIAWAVGSRMSADQAITYALNLRVPSDTIVSP